MQTNTVTINDTIDRIKRQISQNPVLLYMKGTPDFPMCGFSSRVVQILNGLHAQYSYVNILENQDIRMALPHYANWPTFPQLYVQGELIGGCDIVSEMHQKAELKPVLQSANALGDTESKVIIALE